MERKMKITLKVSQYRVFSCKTVFRIFFVWDGLSSLDVFLSLIGTNYFQLLIVFSHPNFMQIKRIKNHSKYERICFYSSQYFAGAICFRLTQTGRQPWTLRLRICVYSLLLEIEFSYLRQCFRY